MPLAPEIPAEVLHPHFHRWHQGYFSVLVQTLTNPTRIYPTLGSELQSFSMTSLIRGAISRVGGYHWGPTCQSHLASVVLSEFRTVSAWGWGCGDKWQAFPVAQAAEQVEEARLKLKPVCWERNSEKNPKTSFLVAHWFYFSPPYMWRSHPWIHYALVRKNSVLNTSSHQPSTFCVQSSKEYFFSTRQVLLCLQQLPSCREDLL